MIKIKQRGNFKYTEKFLNGVKDIKAVRILEKYAMQGVAALSSATPVDTGETAAAWDYRIEQTSKGVKLSWINTNSENGVPVAILIQYGHATGNGAYVQGVDFINPAIKPILEKISQELLEEVTNL